MVFFYGNPRYVFGFIEVGDNPDLLISQIGKALNVSLVKNEKVSAFPSVAYWFRDSSGNYGFNPNKNSSETYWYPWQPECDWILECKVSKDKFDDIEQQLSETVAYKMAVLHRPHPNS